MGDQFYYLLSFDHFENKNIMKLPIITILLLLAILPIYQSQELNRKLDQDQNLPDLAGHFLGSRVPRSDANGGNTQHGFGTGAIGTVNTPKERSKCRWVFSNGRWR